MERHPDTALVQGGRPQGPGAMLNTPLTLNSTFRTGGELSYGRSGNETWEAFESVIGELEGGTAVAFASGIAAASAVLDLVPVGGTVVAPVSLYMGLWSQLRERAQAGRINVHFVDQTDTAAVLTAAQDADLVWVETPSNPLLQIADIAAIAEGLDETTLLVVDGTFTTPLLQQPLALGADLVVHSATKLIGGHADLLMGVAIGSDELATRLRDHRYAYGATPGSLEAYLALRGLRTLAVRLERAQANAQAVAEFLADSNHVTYVLYPGLSWHRGHALAAKQMRGFGTVLSFELAAGPAAAERLCNATHVFANATSLGGVESLIEVRGNRESERAMGTPEALIRVSAGIEHGPDLIADLAQALAIAHQG
jgi:cystathionine gamma-synthase